MSLATPILFRCHAQNRFTSYPANYTTVLSNGIRIRFVSKGQLARFDFPTFALSLLSFVVLFGAVTSALDFYASHFLCDPLLARNFATARKQEVCCTVRLCCCLSSLSSLLLLSRQQFSTDFASS